MSRSFRIALMCTIICFCLNNAQALCCGNRHYLADSLCVEDALYPESGPSETEVVLARSELTLACWNIGHFSNGKKETSTIPQESFNNKLDAYKKLVYEVLAPDVICINELSPVFGEDTLGKMWLAEEVVFNGFENRFIGEQRNYSCNAIFSKSLINNFKVNDFECGPTYSAEITYATDYYYKSADLYIDGETVKLVCLHLAPRAPKLRKQQMEELVAKFKEFDRVIMCGDWNAADKDAMNIFIKAGYTVANDGSIATYSTKMTPLDNIVVKGLNVSDVRVVETDLSDHYPLMCKISLK